MSATISILIPVFSFILYSMVLLLVLISKPYSKPQLAFRGYLVGMLFWSFSAFIVLVGYGDSLFWFKLMNSSAMGSMIGIIYFVQKFLSKERRWAKWVYRYGFMGMVVTMFDNTVVKAVSVSEGAVFYEWGPLFPFIVVVIYAFYIFCAVELVRAFYKSKDELQRNRLRYLIIGLVSAILLSLVNFTPWGRYPIDVAANGFLAVLIAYAILRHQLLDIKLVIRKGLLYFIPATILSATYFIIIWVALDIFHAYSGMQVFIVSLLVALLTAMILQPFHQKAQAWIDKIFFREKYDANQLLQRFSHTAASTLDLDRLSSMFLGEITSNFHISRAALFIRRNGGLENPENGGYYQLAAQSGLDLEAEASLRSDHPIALWLINKDGPLTIESMDITPAFKALWQDEREQIESLDAEIFIPIKARDDLVGILALGPKLSEMSYSNDDQLMLTTLATQTAVAIENAAYFDAEQSRRMELDALYSLSRQLLDAENKNEIMHSLVESAVKNIPVSYAAFLSMDEDGYFTQQASYHQRNHHKVIVNQLESPEAQDCYHKAVSRSHSLLLRREEINLEADWCFHPLIRAFQSLCLSPLMIGEMCIGMLVLGEVRNPDREPFNHDKLRLIRAICQQTASAIQRSELREQLEENFIETIVALANAVDARDSYIHGHSERMASLAMLVLRELTDDKEQIQAMNWAAMLHDIGKIGIPDAILRKPGPLTAEEWGEMKKHPEIGAKIIEPVKRLSHVAPIVRAHHERYDGTGYPRGLRGEAIPLGARVLAVVDAYGAMVDERVYRKARSHGEAIEELKRCSGTQFDPCVVETFLRIAEHLMIRA